MTNKNGAENDNEKPHDGSPVTVQLDSSHEDEIIQECRCCCNDVNRSLLPSKLFYFFFFAANGSLIPYLILFFKQLGLTPSQVGIVSGLKPFISFLFSPLWGYVADKSRKAKIVFVISLLAYVGGYVAYSFAPARNVCNLRTNISSALHHPFMFHMHKRQNNFENDVKNVYTLYSRKSKIKKSDIITGSTKRVMRQNHSGFINRHGIESGNSTVVGTARMSLLFTDITPGLMGESFLHLPVNLFGSNSIDEFMPPVADFTETKDDDIEDLKSINSEKTWSGAVHYTNSPWTVCAAAKANSIDNINFDQSSSSDKDKLTKTFYYLLIVTISATLFSCPLITIVDTATIRKLRETNSTHKYGNQRLWGSFGWGIMAFSVGAIVSALPLCPGVNKEVNYYIAFYIFAVLLVIALIVGLKLQFEDATSFDGSCEHGSNEQSGISHAQRILDGLKLLREPVYCSFIMTSFYIGVTMSIIKTFLFWHLKDIGGSQILFSIIAGINCLAEVSVYHFSSILIKKLTHIGVLYVALLCYSLRLFYYGLLTNPWYVLAAEPLSGVTTAAAWATMTSYVGANAAPESVTTMQGILHGIHWGLGHGCGELIGGFMVSNLGASQTFNIFGALTLLHLLIFWLVNNYSKKNSHPSYQEFATEENESEIDNKNKDLLKTKSQ